MTGGQKLAFKQLSAVAAASSGTFEVLDSSLEKARSGDVYLSVKVGLSCAGLKRVPDGLPLRAREEFTLWIPPDFPFDEPSVFTRHNRFAHFRHVQWSRQLCLYAAPDVEWNPNDGIYGFLTRLIDWLEAASMNELDPEHLPLHPPVAYVKAGYRTVVVRQNTPAIKPPAWFGLSEIRQVSETRVDIDDWSDLFSSTSSKTVGGTILLNQSMPFEYPETLRGLLTVLESRGINREMVMLTLRAAAMNNEKDTPLYVTIGTPMRGVVADGELKQHLSVWRIDETKANTLRASLAQYSSDPQIRELGEAVMGLLWDWTNTANVEWCLVQEARDEVSVRRDLDTPMSKLAGLHVELWGCGALGSHIAEMLARAGVRKLTLRDNKTVGVGVLVRQNFVDGDIGEPKAVALCRRLEDIRSDLEVDPQTSNLRAHLDTDNWSNGVDLVIDTTGSTSVLAKEELRHKTRGGRPTLVSMAIDATAKYGIAAIVRPEHSGGLHDALRQTKLVACNQPHLEAYREAFWSRDDEEQFFPEPGCSSPTFIGSAADIEELSSGMLNVVAGDVLSTAPNRSMVHFVNRIKTAAKLGQRDFSFTLESALVLTDEASGYEIRIAASAWRDMKGWIARSNRRRGPSVETGGVMFGERNEVLKIVWVDEVGPPPTDSEAERDGFICGTNGVAEAVREKRARTKESVQFVGLWHTHPGGEAIPSITDVEGMWQTVDSTDPSVPAALMVIVGGNTQSPRVLARVFTREEFEGGVVDVRQQGGPVSVSKRDKEPTIGLTLSGGGSRAIAFHLGCLRALHDRGILEKVRVISSVSGGSIIGSMYAYSNEPFEKFDERVVALLREGLTKAIVGKVFSWPLILGQIGTSVSAGLAALSADLLRTSLIGGSRVVGTKSQEQISRLLSIQPPFRRWRSRTSAFQKALEDVLGSLTLSSPRRREIDVVINSCELRSGSAFRFGSKESGCWRYGSVKSETIPLALAVAASAAYPVLLPALDLKMEFQRRDGSPFRERVLLTDGGVYDNLGVSCLDPGKSEEFSYNVFAADYIIACDAGHGMLDTRSVPYWWAPRVVRAYQSLFNKTQNHSHERLHRNARDGLLDGFILAYLGQQDARLPYIPPDLIRREEVFGYPTDFSPMSNDMLEKLTARGEVLTRLLLNRYCPGL